MSDTPSVDWDAAANSPEFKELIAQKRRFVAPGHHLLFDLVPRLHRPWPGSRPTSWARRSIEGVTIGYIFALSQFIMVWVLAAVYLRRADKVFDPLAAKAAQRASEGVAGSHGQQPRRTLPAR